MLVSELKDRLKDLDDNKMVIISNGEGWCNIDAVVVKGHEVLIMEEREPVFSD